MNQPIVPPAITTALDSFPDKTLVLATGVFDLLHPEHINFLEKAKATGDILVVGIESDARVKSLKGPNRPINPASQRLQNLKQLNIADHIFILPDSFNSPAAHQQLIATIKPDILAVSSHSPHLDKKQAILKKHGGQVKIVHQHNPNLSTSKLLDDHLHIAQPTPFQTSVISGHGRGKLLGFPTLNLTPPPDLNLPHGIYAGWVAINSTLAKGAFHFGPVPTFNQPEPTLEVFVLDQKLTTTPPNLSFTLAQYLRPIKQFDNPKSLVTQIKLDVHHTQKLLTTPPPSLKNPKS